MSDKIWYLYVLRCADGTYYTGVTTDVKRRLHEHNNSNRGSKYTKARRPVELLHFSQYESRSAAQRAEHSFKKLTRAQKERRLDEGQ